MKHSKGTYFMALYLDNNILPSIPHQQDRLSEPEGAAHQHAKPPHSLSPDHMAKLLRHTCYAGHKWTCQIHTLDVTSIRNIQEFTSQ